MALIDSGAMPSLLCRSALPIGVVIKDSTVHLTGVSKKKIPIMGEAEVPFAIGSTLLSQRFLIVSDDQMEFPQGCTAILGANCLAGNSIIIDPVEWSLYRGQERLSEMSPAIIEGELYQAPDVTSQKHPPDHMLQIPVHQRIEEEPVSFTIRETAWNHKKPTSSKPLPHREKQVPPIKHNNRLNARQRGNYVNGKREQCLATGNQYLVLPIASYQLKTGTTAVKVSLQCTKTDRVIQQSETQEFMVEQNLFCPGVFVSQTAISGKHLMVQVTNTLKSPIMLFRGVPIASAFELTEDSCEFYSLEIWNKDKYIPMDLKDETSRSVMTMYTLSEMTTPRAEDSTQGPDDLDKALEFDPREINPEPPTYDENRFQRIMSQIDTSL